MSGEAPVSNHQNTESTGWTELAERQSDLSDEWKSLITDGIYDIDKKPTEEYLSSTAGQKAAAVEAKFNQDIAELDQDTAQINHLQANLEEQVQAGAISEEQAQKYRETFAKKREKIAEKQEDALNAAIDQIDGYRQDYVDSQVVGTPESEWIDDSEIHSREEVLKAHEEAQADTKPIEAAPLASDAQPEDASEVEPDAQTDTEADAQVTPEDTSETEPDAAVTPELKVRIELEHQLEQEMADAEQLEALQRLVEAEQDAEALGNLQTAAEAEQGDTAAAESGSDATETQPAPETTPDLEALGQVLYQQRMALAELFVKKNRILGPKHREEYDEARKEYESTRDEYLRLQAEAGQNDTNPLENYLQEDNALLAEVENRVDNGNLYRKFISKIFGNKYYKQAMLAYGVRSLGVTSAEDANTASSIDAASVIAPSRNTTLEDAISQAAEATSATEPEPAGPEPTTEAAEATEAAETTTEAPGKTPEELEQGARRAFQATLERTDVGTIAGPAGVEFMSIPNNAPGREANLRRIADWWSGTSDVIKKTVREYEATQADSPFGDLLRIWLEEIDAQSGNSAPEAPVEPGAESEAAA